MEILPLLIGISIVAVIAIAGVFVWAVRSGQFDDLDTPAVRILADEDESPPSG
ncbi:MAG: cbb3-type cytochrome oxidase assembly protein CcoS [Thiotrichales bacterium]|nr:cbb3-type cytochrome oxidase assembly protein CcoS [Thiotrichales bacterium]